jgi:hypothetical protein
LVELVMDIVERKRLVQRLERVSRMVEPACQMEQVIELDTLYSLSIDKGTLTLRNGDKPPQKLAPIAKDEFDAGDFGRFVFERNSDGRVLCFRVFTQAARGIEFSKAN